MNKRKDYLIKELVKYCGRLDTKGFVANHDGNLSVRFDDVLLATPTAESKANIVTDMIITLDHSGNKLEGIGKPFSEIKLHLACYKTRPEINCVIHAHPPFATARGLTGVDLIPSLPEAIVSLGDLIPVTPFAMPGESENDSIIQKYFSRYDIVMFPGNGVLAVGDNIEQAYLRIELLEHLCKIDTFARSMGSKFELTADQKSNLMDKRKKAGLGPKDVPKSTSMLISEDDIRGIVKGCLEKL